MSNHRRTAATRPIRLLVAGTGIAAGALVLAGCASPGASGDAAEGPAIVATTTQVGDFTRELVGSSAEVTQLLSPGQSAHSFDPSAGQLLALAGAEAIVVNGGGLESWLDDAIAASGFDGVLIDASEGIELYGTDDHAEANGEHAGEGHADEGHVEQSADDHSGHDHGDGNPHIWTDPELAERMVANIAHGLVEVPGVDAAEVEANESDYTAELVALDEWISENAQRCRSSSACS